MTVGTLVVKEAARFKLPSTPVVYEPEGMTKKSLEQEFAISPQALFHVMFGELSPLFQTLYAQRRAQGNTETLSGRFPPTHVISRYSAGPLV
jgi:hypothetical protein